MSLANDHSSRLIPLDGLRGIAAILVVMHHEGAYFGTAHLVPRGYLAVDFFFMLSGFVLTLAYENRLKNEPARRFLAFRLARLWPLLAISVLVAGVAHFIDQPQAHLDVVLVTLVGLLLIPLLNQHAGIYPLDGPEWSLTFELIANFIHASLLCRLDDRKVLFFALACACGLAVVAQRFGDIAVGDIGSNWWAGFFRVGYSYALGVWMARKFRSESRSIDLGRWWFAALMPLPMILFFAPILPLPRALGDCLIDFALLPPVLWLAAQVNLPRRSQSPLNALGRLSYPLYTIHVPLLWIAAKLAADQAPSTKTAICIASLFAIVLIGYILGGTSFAKGFRLPKRATFAILPPADSTASNIARPRANG